MTASFKPPKLAPTDTCPSTPSTVVTPPLLARFSRKSLVAVLLLVSVLLVVVQRTWLGDGDLEENKKATSTAHVTVILTVVVGAAMAALSFKSEAQWSKGFQHETTAAQSNTASSLVDESDRKMDFLAAATNRSRTSLVAMSQLSIMAPATPRNRPHLQMDPSITLSSLAEGRHCASCSKLVIYCECSNCRLCGRPFAVVTFYRHHCRKCWIACCASCRSEKRCVNPFGGPLGLLSKLREGYDITASPQERGGEAAVGATTKGDPVSNMESILRRSKGEHYFRNRQQALQGAGEVEVLPLAAAVALRRSDGCASSDVDLMELSAGSPGLVDHARRIMFPDASTWPAKKIPMSHPPEDGTAQDTPATDSILSSSSTATFLAEFPKFMSNLLSTATGSFFYPSILDGATHHKLEALIVTDIPKKPMCDSCASYPALEAVFDFNFQVLPASSTRGRVPLRGLALLGSVVTLPGTCVSSVCNARSYQASCPHCALPVVDSVPFSCKSVVPHYKCRRCAMMSNTSSRCDACAAIDVSLRMIERDVKRLQDERFRTTSDADAAALLHHFASTSSNSPFAESDALLRSKVGEQHPVSAPPDVDPLSLSERLLLASVAASVSYEFAAYPCTSLEHFTGPYGRLLRIVECTSQYTIFEGPQRTLIVAFPGTHDLKTALTNVKGLRRKRITEYTTLNNGVDVGSSSPTGMGGIHNGGMTELWQYKLHDGYNTEEKCLRTDTTLSTTRLRAFLLRGGDSDAFTIRQQHPGGGETCNAAPPPMQPPAQNQGYRRILFAGHSLGGAMAVLVSLRCLKDDLASFGGGSINCLTFGAPFVGDSGLSRMVSRSGWTPYFHNVVFGMDVIPRIPAFFGKKHLQAASLLFRHLIEEALGFKLTPLPPLPPLPPIPQLMEKTASNLAEQFGSVVRWNQTDKAEEKKETLHDGDEAPPKDDAPTVPTGDVSKPEPPQEEAAVAATSGSDLSDDDNDIDDIAIKSWSQVVSTVTTSSPMGSLIFKSLKGADCDGGSSLTPKIATAAPPAADRKVLLLNAARDLLSPSADASPETFPPDKCVDGVHDEDGNTLRKSDGSFAVGDDGEYSSSSSDGDDDDTGAEVGVLTNNADLGEEGGGSVAHPSDPTHHSLAHTAQQLQTSDGVVKMVEQVEDEATIRSRLAFPPKGCRRAYNPVGTYHFLNVRQGKYVHKYLSTDCPENIVKLLRYGRPSKWRCQNMPFTLGPPKIPPCNQMDDFCVAGPDGRFTVRDHLMHNYARALWHLTLEASN